MTREAVVIATTRRAPILTALVHREKASRDELGGVDFTSVVRSGRYPRDMPPTASVAIAPGSTFGLWVAIRRTEDGSKVRWLCRCTCGTERAIRADLLREGRSTSCGCWRGAKAPPLSDYWTLVESDDTRTLLRCVCGREKWVAKKSVGQSESCGCVALKQRKQKAAQRETLRRDGIAARRAERELRSRMRRSPTFTSWREMLRRCTDPRNRDFKNYGGRGIRVCDRWLQSFENFLADMGPRPARMTIERKNNDGNYEPSNCRWATRTEQNRNSRHNKLTLDLAREAIGRLEMGERPTSVAKRLGVTCEMICAIRIGRAWRELQPFAPGYARSNGG